VIDETSAVRIESVAVWINAFIPRDVIGMTLTLPAGPHAGKTALAGAIRVLTDQRAFSSDPGASARWHSRVVIDLRGAQPSLIVVQRCDWAVTCDRRGDVVCRARASTRDMTASMISGDPVIVRVEGRARHPCAQPLPALEELTFRGTVAYRRELRELALDLMIGLFPAFEGYAAINDGRPSILFRQAPPAGIAGTAAARGAHRRIRTVTDDRDGDGIFC